MRALSIGLILGLSATAAHAALVVSKSPTSNVVCTNAVCAANSANAVLNVKQLRRLLAKHDVTLVSGSQAEDIVVGDEITWASSHRLTFDAWRGIEFQFAVTSQGTGGATLTTNDGGTGGDYVFTNKGKLAFWDTSGSLVINGASYTLVDSVPSLVSAIQAAPNGNFAFVRFYDDRHDVSYFNAISKFGGTFTGLGHTIQGLTLSPSGGFIGFITASGTVRDLILTDTRMVGKRSDGGAILTFENDGVISHVSLDGYVRFGKSQSHLALLAEINKGTIASSGVSGTVLAPGSLTQVGGLVYENDGTIVDCHADVTLQASWRGGGLAALNFGTISRSSAAGAITMHNAKAKLGIVSGGLVAQNAGTIERSFATVAVDGGYGNDLYGHARATSGGLVGFVQSGTIANSYARGPVSVGTLGYAGGLVGQGQDFTASYATGPVSAADGTQDEAGFVWTSGGGAASDYWDTDTTGQAKGCATPANCSGITGLTTAQFQAGLPAGFDPSVWGQSASVNDGYPYLLDNPPR